ncbi:MAG TPA: hypothetical protein VHM93_09235 [Candidatus Acidoferrum sp.]|jgi:hypothetical protein|nr:hypothetical protein [Candidatus Acidoferrum sp.]
MKRLVLALGLAAALLGPSACRKQASDSAAIRSGIMQHLSAIGNLNMSAMDMDVRSVSINGNQAHAEVEFRPKGGGVAGAGMQVAYNLEKREGSWVVLKTQPLGGTIQHPDPNQNPHTNPDVHSGAVPKFNDILNPAGSPPQAALPAGHPQVASPPPTSKSSSTNPELR